MNILNGSQTAEILYRFLGEAGLIADSLEILSRREELLRQALAMLKGVHANPALKLSAYPLPIQHYAVLLINLFMADMMQQADAYSARLPENLSLREQAAFLIGPEIDRHDRHKL